jgi:hypothetical protein
LLIASMAFCITGFCANVRLAAIGTDCPLANQATTERRPLTASL